MISTNQNDYKNNKIRVFKNLILVNSFENHLGIISNSFKFKGKIVFYFLNKKIEIIKNAIFINNFIIKNEVTTNFHNEELAITHQ